MQIGDFSKNTKQRSCCVGIVGGGIAGSTVALRLAELGVRVLLFEQGASLVSGPPMCHLHAGGNFYREIPDQQCLALLRQSIDTLRIYPDAANVRPTLLAVPVRDKGDPEALLPRLKMLQAAYGDLINEDLQNEVLGPADEYFRVYPQNELERLAEAEIPVQPITLDDWMIPVARNLNLEDFKFPLIIVQEYGLSAFRIAAAATLALQSLDRCKVLNHARVIGLDRDPSGSGWLVAYESSGSGGGPVRQSAAVDFLVNACGYRTGALDDMAGFKRDRLVEFKASYMAYWPQCQGSWPEIIIYGERRSPEGMAQLTPYPGGYFQLHGMTEDITLFKDGLSASCDRSAQPRLPDLLLGKLSGRWDAQEVVLRTQRAIAHVAQFIPAFGDAEVGGDPLFGAQQIPGGDPSLRAADVSFSEPGYARAEIVKSSSALTVANEIVQKLQENGLINLKDLGAAMPLKPYFSSTANLSHDDIVILAEKLAAERAYPLALARKRTFITKA